MRIAPVGLALLENLFESRPILREPEDDGLMGDTDQVAAYVEGGSTGEMAAAYTFHAARIAQVIEGCRSVIDLGCGPATQLEHVARLCPDVRFTGVDLASPMIAAAERRRAERALGNVDFRLDDVTTLATFPDASADGIVCCMTLHHLPSLDVVDRTFRTMRRVLRPGGALYVTDFGRLRSRSAIRRIAYRGRHHHPELFCRDFERSLRAAFLAQEILEVSRRYFPDTEVRTTFGAPLLVVIKSSDRQVPPEGRKEARATRSRLAMRDRVDLDLLRLFFRLGGLGNDPFWPRWTAPRAALRLAG